MTTCKTITAETIVSDNHTVKIAPFVRKSVRDTSFRQVAIAA